MAMALTAKDKPYKLGFAPFAPEVYRSPFPYCYRWPTGSDPDRVSEECFEAFLERIRELPRESVAAVIIEPVLGEGGFIPAPPRFLSCLRALCSEEKIILIADEIQTGFGRTGDLFASRALGLEPDLILTAKGLGGGLPLSAVTGRREIMDAPMEGGIGGTFGGNPLSCEAALAVVSVFEDQQFLSHINSLGEMLKARLSEWQTKYSVIGDVRGLGPMQAIELVKDRGSKEPNPEATKQIVKHCYERGVVIMNAGTYGNVIRFLPPLVISLEDLREGLEVIESAFR
jgi:4-aminobutyrate aminotransferase/(S)-3-amino-2-methylpropionate transaminase